MNNEVNDLYSMPVTKATALRGADSRELEAYRRENAARNEQAISDSAYAKGRNEGFSEGFRDLERRLSESSAYTPVVEGSPQAYEMDNNVQKGLNYGLLEDVQNQLANQHQQTVDFNSLDNETQNSVMEDVQNSAFIKARDMGDTSEDNMNNLMINELKLRGIQ